MNENNIQPNPNYNAAFTPGTAPLASQQQAANLQTGPVPPLGNALDVSNNPSARNLQNYSVVAGEQDLDTNGGLQHLRGLPQLTSLDLVSRDKLTDAGLQYLGGVYRG